MCKHALQANDKLASQLAALRHRVSASEAALQTDPLPPPPPPPAEAGTSRSASDADLAALRKALAASDERIARSEALIAQLQAEISGLKKALAQAESQRDFYAEKNEEMIAEKKSKEKVRHIAAAGFV